MSSVVALTGNAGQANYTAAKAGLIGFTKTVALEVASRGITVNSIAPGFIETRMVEKLTEELRGKIHERIPLARFGSSADVAAAVAFLASDDAAYITGQVLSIDGGLGL
jgi:3-oxoacyl-[acyl-carrier protein] reductase